MERSKTEAEIQGLVRVIQYASQENDIVCQTRDWNTADIEYAINRLQTDCRIKEQEEGLREIWNRLRAERRREELDAERHSKVLEQIEVLKKSHWSVVPNFWMTVVILILTGVAAVAAVMSLLE